MLVCGLNNHGRTRTALPNVRADFGTAERQRGMSVSVRGLDNYMLVRGSNPFVFCNDTVPGKLFPVEIDDVSKRQACGLQIVEELSLVFGQDGLYGLEFKNDPVVADEVGDVVLLKRLPPEENRQGMFALERYVGVAKCDGKRLLIDGLKKTGTKFVEYINADAENLVSRFAVDQHLFVPFVINHGRTLTVFARPLETLLRKAPHFVRRGT